MSESERSLVTTEIDFDADGLQHGVLRIPYSHDRSAYGFVPTPLWVAKGGEGPTVLLTGGVHGDEYEGPVALMRLLHEGFFEKVNGRIIVIPALNAAAYRQGTRTSPIDGVNLNRAFPGKRKGTVTEMLAHYVETVLLPMVDVFIDLHAGGTSLNYLPALVTYKTRDPAEREKLAQITRGFDPPLEMVMDLAAEDRTIGGSAFRNNVLFLGGEFGGGATVSQRGVEVVTRGLWGALGALGVVPPQPIKTKPPTPTARYEIIPNLHYLYAPKRGVFEPTFALGDWVKSGQLAGRLYDQEEPWRAPTQLYFKDGGMVVCVRTLAMAEGGDCLVHLASVEGAPVAEEHARSTS